MIEHVCSDGYLGWGTPEDCPNCLGSWGDVDVLAAERVWP